MDWPVEVLVPALDQIRQAANVDVILLTKWPELFAERMQAAKDFCVQNQMQDLFIWLCCWLGAKLPPRNVWILTSVLGNALDARRVAGVLKIPAAGFSETFPCSYSLLATDY